MASPGAVTPAVSGRFRSFPAFVPKRPKTAGMTAPGEVTWDPFSRLVRTDEESLIYYCAL